ncbi:MAG TPA: aminodeoxychorismate/anthranilate synthase component II [Bacteroidales bacterium]|nr:aminodeoxychorismate/anthranilate synthase component II [Bacteroidales bacterium]HPT21425.1 aminodeoxychorismate/anthranilate synthase component II [Bacteroidales bacterium]
MKKILVIDNYDSFTYNLVHYIEKLTGVKPAVFRNDEISLDAAGNYDKILISPGPGIPREAGICIDLIKRYSPEKSILGICLGLQAIGESFGAGLENLSEVYHGIASKITVIDEDDQLFKGIPPSFNAGRYHSWIVSRKNIPDCLKITCIDDNNMIMGMRHKDYDVRGLQFHPESVLTEFGYDIIRNWVEL